MARRKSSACWSERAIVTVLALTFRVQSQRGQSMGQSTILDRLRGSEVYLTSLFPVFCFRAIAQTRVDAAILSWAVVLCNPIIVQ
jgi:hypothetical protein